MNKHAEWLRGEATAGGSAWSANMLAAADEIERLSRDVNTLNSLIRDKGHSQEEEIARLRSAIQQTLEENGHLADGDNCTLILLKRAVEVPNAEVLECLRKSLPRVGSA
jgi:ElaB/YqjD/DUF883 family membrane-anchored ribosome-binding protein